MADSDNEKEQLDEGPKPLQEDEELKAKFRGARDVQFFKWLDDQEHADCTFIVGHDLLTQKTFECHRLVLAAASPAFEKMLLGQFQEGQQGPNKVPITLKDCDHETFSLVLRFVYGCETTGVREAKKLDTVVNVFTFAAKWQVALLDKLAADLCLKYELDVEDLFHLHLQFEQHKFTDKAEEVLQLMCDRGSEVLASLELASLETVEALLRSERLNIFSEKEVLYGLLKWGAAQASQAAAMNLSPVDIGALLTPLVWYIRFGTFSKTDFTIMLEDFNKIFSSVEIATIMALMEKMKKENCKGFDLEAPWRGLFRPDPILVKVNHPFDYEELVGEKSFLFPFNIEDKPVYLLGVGVHSLCHLNPGLQMNLQITLQTFSVTDMDWETVSECSFKTECNKFSHACLTGSMVRLVNPILLSTGKDYRVVVKHQHDGPRMVPKIEEEADYMEVTVKGLYVNFAPQEGDVCALEFGCPFQEL
ncbi:uncharacterized protein LOC132201009 [Neocloeon triangulifer]|uniref:uncharacterized protein LOC132201009 n=1 Tax=Neocloeon triangulifer TaxID=2078957 RepID=UPI00286EF89E|nr:uncharacterized protein LOC132201009 [Neocloeon triangulifer]XP_059482849.1 uncharacterized protein LOC132201009 [Neocloeon triangulifer]